METVDDGQRFVALVAVASALTLGCAGGRREAATLPSASHPVAISPCRERSAPCLRHGITILSADGCTAELIDCDAQHWGVVLRVWLDGSIQEGKIAREQAPSTITLRADFDSEGKVVAVEPASELPAAIAEWIPIMKHFGLAHSSGRKCSAVIQWDATSGSPDGIQK